MPVQVIDLAALSSDQGFAIVGDAVADATGFSVSNIGDVNGDGIDDVAVGVLRGDSGAPDGGDVYVIFGKMTGFPATMDLANFGAGDGFVIGGDEVGDFAGFSVAGAGDLNGDGIADLVVGALYGDDGGSNAGEAYVIFGKAGPFRSAIDLGSLAASDGFIIQGDRSGDHAGRSVAVAGDINGDGVDDLIVGAFRGDNRGLDAGEAYVVYGIAGPTRANLDLSLLSAAEGFVVEGDSPGDLAGFSVAGVGDINGDGIGDIAIGSRDNDEGGTNAGAAYVLFGRAGAARPTVNLAALSAADGFKITGAAAYDELGTSVSGAGDINGDGIDDLVVGAPGNDASAPNAGAAYVIFGRSGASRETVYLNALGPGDGFAIFGEADGDLLGNSVSGAGDVNGDGLQDLLVSALYSDGGGVKAGATYVILGQPGGTRSDLSVANLDSREGLVIRGAAAGDYSGRAVSGAGDINGDGIDDILVGATGNDAGGDFAGAAYVIFGHANQLANRAPAGSDTTLTIDEDTPRTLTMADFGFSDVDGNSLFAVRIASVPSAGTLILDGSVVTAGTTVPVGSLSGLVFTPAANTNGTGYASFTFQVQDNGGTANGGIDLDASANTIIFNVTAIDDAPVAVQDPTNAVSENATVAISAVANDTDVDGGPLNVVTINGSAASIGNAITLASGATATLNADGSINYSPNGQFIYLISAATASATGAVNSSATDSFSYALNGSSSASVTVTINGVDGTGSELRGDVSANTLTGTAGNDLYNLSQGGNDAASGGIGNDGFYFGGAFDDNDSVDGGAGSLDQVALQGNYSAGVTLGASSAVGIEQYVLLPGSNTRFGVTGSPTLSYNITTGNAAIAAGNQLTFQANTLRAGESFVLDASGELDGSVFTYGGLGTENLRGSQNADAFFFGTGRFNAGDVVDGQGGFDQLGLQGAYSGANAINFSVGQMLNVEMIVCLSNNDSRFGGAGSGTPYSYTLTMNDGNVAAGATLTIQANGLASDEVVTFNGSAELDGHYTIFSGNGADSIIGGGLSDTISGRGSADNLTGGGGSDIFLYTNLTDSIAAAQDHILDFTSGDIIDLSRLDAITGGANNAFAFIGDAVFGNTAGQLRAVNTAGNDWLVEADVNGDGVADLSILVTVSDAHVLAGADFLL